MIYTVMAGYMLGTVLYQTFTLLFIHQTSRALFKGPLLDAKIATKFFKLMFSHTCYRTVG